MDWKHLLAYITGTVDQELLLRNEYLVTENRILRSQLTGRVRLSDGERKALAKIGYRLGKQALQDVERVHPHAHGDAGGDRLLHRGGLDTGRIGDLLRALFHPSEQPENACGRRDPPSQRTMDGPGGAQRDHGRVGLPVSWPVPHP